MEVTVDYCEGTYSVYMCFYILAFRIHPTFIRAGYWVALTHWPVVVDHIFIHRAIVLAVVTAERTLGTLTFMRMHMLTLKVLAAVATCNWSKLTANKLLATFWIQIQVSIQFSQLPRPLTATLLVHTPHTKGVQCSL